MSIAPQIQSKTVSETRNVSISFSGKLDNGELLTGTPTVTEGTTSDLTIANEAVNTAILDINKLSVPIGEAVQFSVLGGAAGTTYEINISCATDATPAQTLRGKVYLKVNAD